MNSIIIGGGEVGSALYELLGGDIPVNDLDTKKCKPYPEGDTDESRDIMHVCFPYGKQFKHVVVDYIKHYNPKMIIIHSTVPVGTSYSIQSLVGKIIIIYAPTRGVHSRFVKDMKTYTKLWASVNPMADWEIDVFEKIWKDARIATERWDSIKDLELAKVLVDTTYYGWLIAFRFAADQIAENYGADKEKIWEFADEIHETLGNRPRMFSNVDGIGGHCVLPNLELNSDRTSDYLKNIINVINSQHRRSRPQ
jgi:UDP-N-acetyl-D-mannosaminuronate dehydrogenase